jgi:phenylpropionate dioxygenase-like ring-hydroxylating dioxygenase large terminal subunit
MQAVKNSWYVAALSREVAPDEILPARILGEPVAIYRQANGEPAAVEDVCPHRFAPLSIGRVADGAIECGYHGLRFDGGGVCVYNPRGDGGVNDRLVVRAYPVAEQRGAVWIWPGDPAKADRALIPDTSHLDEVAEEHHTLERFSIKANYELIADNLMDATHADYIHPTLLSSRGAFGRNLPDISQDERGVKASYNWDNLPAQPGVDRLLKHPGEPAMQRISFEWRQPSHIYIVVKVWQESDPDHVLHSQALHTLTPASEDSTDYFVLTWSNNGGLTPEAKERRRAGMIHAFRDEDAPMLEAVQERMAGRDFWSMRPAILAGDNAQVLARRRLQQLIRAEAAEAVPEAVTAIG